MTTRQNLVTGLSLGLFGGAIIAFVAFGGFNKKGLATGQDFQTIRIIRKDLSTLYSQGNFQELRFGLEQSAINPKALALVLKSFQGGLITSIKGPLWSDDGKTVNLPTIDAGNDGSNINMWNFTIKKIPPPVPPYKDQVLDLMAIPNCAYFILYPEIWEATDKYDIHYSITPYDPSGNPITKDPNNSRLYYIDPIPPGVRYQQ